MFNFKKLYKLRCCENRDYYDIPNFALEISYIIFVTLLFFAYINIAFRSNYIVGYGELAGSVLTLIATIYFMKSNNLRFYLIFITSVLFSVTLVFYFFTEPTRYSSIFLLLFPLLAFLLNGIKIGLVYSLIYDIIIFVSAYSLVMQNLLSMVAFLQIFIGLLAFTAISYYVEYSRRETYLKMKEAIQKLENISYYDELTSLYNRHYLNEKILKDEKLINSKVTFCIIDLDNFKAYNDFYGHQQGDDVLKSVAQVFRESFRHLGEAYVIRLGGEEFGGFIFNSEDSRINVNEFCLKVNNLNIEHIGNSPYNKCTVSLGAVTCSSINDISFSKLYKRTDEALYEAKVNGRNQVVYKSL